MNHNWYWVTSDELFPSRSWYFLLNSEKIVIILGDRKKEIRFISSRERTEWESSSIASIVEIFFFLFVLLRQGLTRQPKLDSNSWSSCLSPKCLDYRQMPLQSVLRTMASMMKFFFNASATSFWRQGFQTLEWFSDCKSGIFFPPWL